ncbi:MAG: hypothetical protein ACOCQG_03485 [Candidatus Nanoarchaeia archaeon]
MPEKITNKTSCLQLKGNYSGLGTPLLIYEKDTNSGKILKTIEESFDFF